jgi:hypothetical protein
MKFTAKILLKGINPYVLVSAARAARIKKNWKKPMPILVQVNGKPEPAWRINMMPAGDGSFYLYLAGVVRKASGTQVGDRVEISIAFDGGYKNGPQHNTTCLRTSQRSWRATRLSKHGGKRFHPASKKKFCDIWQN